jgi:hypothetical protein
MLIFYSVADLACLSRILIFPIPDPRSRISDPRSRIQQQQKRGGEKICFTIGSIVTWAVAQCHNALLSFWQRIPHHKRLHLFQALNAVTIFSIKAEE